MLAARRDALALQRFHDRAAEPGDVLRAFGQRAIADRGIGLVGQDVEHGREVERDPDRPQLGGERARETPGQLLIAAAPERHHRRPHGERGFEPRDPSAFLIGADPQRQLRRELLRLAREIRHLFRPVHVAREENDAAKVELTRQHSQIGRNGVPRKAGNRKLARMAAHIPDRHPADYTDTVSNSGTSGGRWDQPQR